MYIAIDLDHTLLNEKSELSEYAISVLKKCRALGHKIIVSTARSYVRSISIAEKIGADYINSFAGNLITDSKGKVIHINCFSGELLKSLLEANKNISAGNVAIETKDKSYTTNAYYANILGAEIITYEECLNFEVLKLIFAPHQSDKSNVIAEEIAKAFNVEISWGRELNFYRLMPKNTDKWLGLKFLLELEGANAEDLIAFGDDYTDYLSLKNAGIGVKMANSRSGALDDIKQSTSSNDQDGVSSFLEKYFKLNELN